jgi:hypothetical protein
VCLCHFLEMSPIFKRRRIRHLDLKLKSETRLVIFFFLGTSISQNILEAVGDLRGNPTWFGPRLFLQEARRQECQISPRARSQMQTVCETYILDVGDCGAIMVAGKGGKLAQCSVLVTRSLTWRPTFPLGKPAMSSGCG